MLSNMFDPTSESEPGWENDIRDDVLEECNVHGPVLHIHVDTFSQVRMASYSRIVQCTFMLECCTSAYSIKYSEL